MKDAPLELSQKVIQISLHMLDATPKVSETCQNDLQKVPEKAYKNTSNGWVLKFMIQCIA